MHGADMDNKNAAATTVKPSGEASNQPIRDLAEIVPALQRCLFAEGTVDAMKAGAMFDLTPKQQEDLKRACDPVTSPHIFLDAQGNDRVMGAPLDVRMEYLKFIDAGLAIRDQLDGLCKKPDGLVPALVEKALNIQNCTNASSQLYMGMKRVIKGR